MVVVAKRGASKSIKLLLTINLLATTADNPTIRRILAVAEPIAVETTTSVAPLKVAAIETAASGKEVPIATIVTPIIKGDIFKARPIFSALSTNQSAPFINKAKLPMKIKIQRIRMFYIKRLIS
jgi:hypothetical protein